MRQPNDVWGLQVRALGAASAPAPTEALPKDERENNSAGEALRSRSHFCVRPTEPHGWLLPAPLP